jgi:hypothetical protein
MLQAIEVIFYQPEFNKDFEFLFNTLSDKEKLVLDLYYGFHKHTIHTSAQIAKHFHLTPTRINQIKRWALLNMYWKAQKLSMERVLIYIDFKFNGVENTYKTTRIEVINNRRIHRENQLYKTEMSLV